MSNNIFSENEQYFPQEIAMQRQTERQEEPLRQQEEWVKAYRETEEVYLNKTLIRTNFISPIEGIDRWLQSRIVISGVNSSIDMRESWAPVSVTNEGLELSSLAIRSGCNIHLKSIACKITLNARLSGDSSLWIFTRSNKINDSNGVVFQVSREMGNKKVKVSFGATIGPNNDYKFFKVQELPVFNFVQNTIEFVEFKLTFIDNGDDKVFLKNSKKNPNTIYMSCNKFIPTFEDHPIILAGTGDSVLLKKVLVKQIERTTNYSRGQDHYECCVLL